MIITESQLRLIVRQELLEVLNENNADVLNEGKFQQLISAIPLVFSFITGAATTTAAMQSDTALSGEPAEQQILHTVGSAEMTDQEVNQLEGLTKSYLESIKKEGSVAKHKSGIQYNADTHTLKYGDTESTVPNSIISGATKFLSLSKSGKSSEASDFLISAEGRSLTAEINKFVTTNKQLTEAVKAQGTQNISFAIAAMSLLMSLIMAVAGANERIGTGSVAKAGARAKGFIRR